MKVREAMHKGVQTREPSTSIAQIAALMKADDIGAVPIVEKGQFLGMVTDRDIAVRAVAGGRDPNSAVAREIMSTGLTCCKEDDSVADAVHLMEKKAIRRLPVTNASNELVGMLSLGDISNAAGKNISSELVRAVTAHH